MPLVVQQRRDPLPLPMLLEQVETTRRVNPMSGQAVRKALARQVTTDSGEASSAGASKSKGR
jgi:hypothetical protein